ncbi:hypothetical protein CCR97_08230 [Rhodoplanes elegans]|uniref:Uncharacterized protein n=1 Tax=Rhodoplanes elegans TaxID=29408 RepID=A0A327KUN2_9BRAD|nr:hypothetical protein [Rhodoplanes elegans]MBK5958106.1 hypothetical protein [Rhodoplanes elegans]MBK5958198.1 hypothetical protein [Rhodoplanes elegans]RAI41981.1 hypothetical protein CH338_01370 [Rhodoplanes elegans]
MAAAQLIATGDTATSSSDQTVADGSTLTVALKGVTGSQARVLIELKDDGGTYNVVGELNSLQPATVIAAPGVYRLTRVAGATCGVYSG